MQKNTDVSVAHIFPSKTQKDPRWSQTTQMRKVQMGCAADTFWLVNRDIWTRTYLSTYRGVSRRFITAVAVKHHLSYTLCEALSPWYVSMWIYMSVHLFTGLPLQEDVTMVNMLLHWAAYRGMTVPGIWIWGAERRSWRPKWEVLSKVMGETKSQVKRTLVNQSKPSKQAKERVTRKWEGWPWYFWEHEVFTLI